MPDKDTEANTPSYYLPTTFWIATGLTPFAMTRYFTTPWILHFIQDDAEK